MNPAVTRLSLLSLFAATLASAQTDAPLGGTIVDTQGRPLSGITVRLLQHNGGTRTARTDRSGHFEFSQTTSATYHLQISASGYQSVSRLVVQSSGATTLQVELVPAITLQESVAVTADIHDLDVLSPDPAEKVFVKQDLLDANPGRPGAPVSIPGYPIETASSGIKAPQYFAPGVAGDHGEPIAQYIAVGSYLLPNNLSANAHGNGYADPNLFIPATIADVQADGGAYNVREGNHSVNLSAVYGLRSHLEPFLTITGDERDLDLIGGISPSAQAFLAFEASFGNGFLDRLEHRKQGKLNAQRVYHSGAHTLTVFGVAYYGSSYIPGLVPLFPLDAGDAGVVNVGDTIDPRQKDQTHTALLAANDDWRLGDRQQLHLAGFFRTYNLSLFSNFGQGLIRQSEFRTVAGQSTNYLIDLSRNLTLLAGFDSNREAPRRDNLDHYNDYTPGSLSYGPFTKVDSSNVTITSLTPYAAASGSAGSFLRYYAGWRRDQIDFTNQDLLSPANSFSKWVGVNSPKATVSFVPKDSWRAPLISASFGQSFFTEDPRIGLGTASGTPVATAHSYQVVLSQSVANTDFKLTLGHVTTSQELGKIDPDTGLQEDQGPGRLRFLTVSARHSFSTGSILVTFSKADARDINSGQPTPEAPRTLLDVLGSVQRLPLGLRAKAEFEYVGRKPLGTGCDPDPAAQCVGTSVREFRLDVARSFDEGHIDLALNAFFASGFTGQTAENFSASSILEVVGVRIPAYASLSITYHFGIHPH